MIKMHEMLSCLIRLTLLVNKILLGYQTKLLSGLKNKNSYTDTKLITQISTQEKSLKIDLFQYKM